MRLLLILALSLSILAPNSANALVMCAKVRKATGEIREGTPIKLRSACKPNEEQIAPAALGLQGPPGEDGDDGADGEDGTDGVDGADGAGLLLLDAASAEIGTVEYISNTSYHRAVLDDAGTVFAVEVSPDGSSLRGTIASNRDEGLWFETTDCSGAPLLVVDELEVPIVRGSTVNPPGSPAGPHEVYYGGERAERTIGSQLWFDGRGCTVGSATLPTADAEGPFLLQGPFTVMAR